MLSIKNLRSFVSQIAESKGLDEEVVGIAIAEALASAYKKDYANKEEKIEAKINERTGKPSFYSVKTIINPNEIETEQIKSPTILLDDAQKINPNAKAGDEIKVELPYQENFSRVGAQTAKQVILQKLREVEKSVVFAKFKEREEGVISGAIQKIDNRAIYVDLGKTTGVMFKNETIPGENYKLQMRMRFYVYGVESTPRGVEVFLSRAHPFFVPAIFKIEVPEISEGLVEVKGVARMPGVRTKMAVFSNTQGVDPVGACIGPKGSRIISIMNELNGEKIDIIPWSEDGLQFAINSLMPAKISEAQILERRTIKMLVTDEQIPIALGKAGQNIKLASKLTGWKIDVRLAQEPEKEIEGGVAEEVEAEESETEVETT
ncbi:MAG: transcription termination factor NusA [Patescibacteria group bacterium]